MEHRLKPLLSLPFIICLMLLIANDFYLKLTFHNTLTGKLSDVCGLFIFPVFFSVLFPRQKLWVFILSGLLFIYWKSEYAAGLIKFVSVHFFGIGRVVDPTDLIALPILLLAWRSLKQDANEISAKRFLAYVNPYLIALLTIFAFCATSRPWYVQTFNQPQYFLYKANALPDSNIVGDDFKFYLFDSLVVVGVDQLYTHDRPARNDDYNKNLSIKGLDTITANMLPGTKAEIDSDRLTTLTIKTSRGNDMVTFKGSRLNGPFVRKKNGKLLIAGTYSMGLENGTWTFNDTTNKQVTKLIFVNGERTEEQLFKDGKLTSASSVATRADVKRNKVIQIIVLTLLMIGTIVMLAKNYRKKPLEKPQISSNWKWLACILMPLAIWILQLMFTCLLGEYQFDLLFMPVSIFMVYVVTCPLLFIIVFGIKVSRKIDLLWYSLLFMLASVIWNEYIILTALAA